MADDRFGYEEMTLAANDEKRIIEAVGKPAKDVMDSLFGKVSEKLQSLPDKTAADCFRRFREIHESEYSLSDSLSHWMTNCRRKYFPVPLLHELDLSVICNSDEFRLFAWDIMNKCSNFFDIYNASLDRYRKEHGIRYNANPFPDLERRKDSVIELPFWLIDSNGGRLSLFIMYGNRSDLLSDDGILAENILDNRNADALKEHQIRPKALVLTMFMRMFASSIFVHGVSGGNYDNVTNSVIKEFYGCKPPEYIVATRTEFPSVGIEIDSADRIKKMKDEIRNMQFNPDEYIPAGNPLAAEKREIIQESGNNTNKEQYRRLKEIRQILVKEIQGKIAEKEKEIENIEKEISKVERVRRRDFPYFFFPTELLED